MRRVRKKPDAIITSDIELRTHAPICRTDEHWKAQEKKIKWLKKLQDKYKCPILDGGDLFDKKIKQYPSHLLLSWAISNLPKNIYTVPGNHDLPGKSIDNYDKSAMKVLEKSGIVQVPYPHFLLMRDIGVYSFPWGVEIKQPTLFQDVNIALVHAMVYDKFTPFPGCEGYEKRELMKILSGFDLIVCGHHHATFTARNRNTILVNPGSLMRNDADQIDFEPSVFLWYAKSRKVVPIKVPIEKGVISREHIEVKKSEDKRLAAFVEYLGREVKQGINFERNVEELLANKKVSQSITKKVWEYYEQ